MTASAFVASGVPAFVAVTLQLLRLSADLIQVASARPDTPSSTTAASSKKAENSEDKPSTDTTQLQSGKPTSYGSVDEEGQALLGTSSVASTTDSSSSPHNARWWVLAVGWTTLGVLLGCLLGVWGDAAPTGFPLHFVWVGSLLCGLELVLLVLDPDRQRLEVFHKMGRLLAWLILWSSVATWVLFHDRLSLDDEEGDDDDEDSSSSFLAYLGLVWAWSSSYPGLVLLLVTSAIGLVLVDGWWISNDPTPVRRQSLVLASQTHQLSRQAVMQLLRPYFWPDMTPSDSTALWNRVRAAATWMFVVSSKACSLTAPLFLGWASTALAHQDYRQAMEYSICYALMLWLASTLKECQSLVYLKVAQTAFVQLAEQAFHHVHNLSLDWHLRKKLGEVLRSMDRGIAACDTLMKYLFLWLVPALVECVVVTAIMASYFQFLPLAMTVFYFALFYIVWTILLTLWRKKFRKNLVKHDNAWHDLFTDSMVNFETVKYFTAEDYEKKRFADAVNDFQSGSVAVQGSLSFLNISQTFLLQSCMAASLCLAAWGIQRRSTCCLETVGCESAISECCRNVDNDVCPGMQVGDFVAVLSYVMNLFQPLFFLGTVYNAIVMAMIDLTNLSELLAENPDVTDTYDAFELPATNVTDPDIAVEFDNVTFHYPTQSETKGLHGLSFKMKKGTTTAIVGPTGAGKTTVSRLLFRFYDVLGGAVKVNGVDVRSVTQKSLRQRLGVVPQAASMFNDTIKSNLRYGKQDATEEELLQAANDAQIVDFINSLDEGWETMVGDRGLKLSGGEKQRAAIARCLLKDPPFVLLDEATSALDTLTESSVQEALDRLGAERTVLVIAHRLGTIRNADNIIVLKDGKVAEEGTHDELLALNGLYADMWNRQLHSASS